MIVRQAPARGPICLNMLVLAWAVWPGLSGGAAAAPPAAPWAVEITLDAQMGPDLGQPWGTLFECFGAEGQSIAAAGFAESSNTQDRSDRRLVQVHLHVADSDQRLPLEPLPRPSSDAGVYLVGFQNRLFAKTRGGTDGQVRVWDPVAGAWQAEPSPRSWAIELAGDVLYATRHTICHGANVLVEVPAEDTLTEVYYGAGLLVWRHLRGDGAAELNQVVAARWQPGQKPPRREAFVTRPLTMPREFIYCHGQHHGAVVAISNTGSILVCDGQAWNTVRAGQAGVSYQVYASLQFGERLLLGQYPTGELFEFDHRAPVRLPGWPGVMPGVSTAAREAQTLAVYGGRLYVGVWPWAEVWRRDRRAWHWLGRALTHPAPTDATTHPYERETQAIDPVLNRWGQRVTSLVPWGDSLYISTSAKASAPHEPKFEFLSPAQASEYGAVYRHRLPGNLAAPVVWKSSPSTWTFRLAPGELSIWQDGRQCGRSVWNTTGQPAAAPTHVTFGRGLFGPTSWTIAGRWRVDAPPRATTPWLATYLDLGKAIGDQVDAPARQTQLAAAAAQVAAAGFDTAMPYANTSNGQTYYPSQVVGRPRFEDGDALGDFIAAARQNHLAVWPAVCVLASGHFEPRGVLEEHPDWALRQLDGRPWGFLSPAHPDARRWVVAQLVELVRRYQPEGLLLDYLRYFNRPYQLDAAAQAVLDAQVALVVDEQQRKQLVQACHEAHLSSLMEAICLALRAEKPDLKIGLYTWGPHVSQNHLVAQAWPRWVDRGWIDLVNVSGYYYPEKYGDHTQALYHSRLAEAVQLAGGAHRRVPVTLTLGIETSHGSLTTGEQVEDYLLRAAQAGVDGAAAFTWSAWTRLGDDLARRGTLARFAAELLLPARENDGPESDGPRAPTP